MMNVSAKLTSITILLLKRAPAKVDAT